MLPFVHIAILFAFVGSQLIVGPSGEKIKRDVRWNFCKCSVIWESLVEAVVHLLDVLCCECIGFRGGCSEEIHCNVNIDHCACDVCRLSEKAKTIPFWYFPFGNCEIAAIRRVQ